MCNVKNGTVNETKQREHVTENGSLHVRMSFGVEVCIWSNFTTHEESRESWERQHDKAMLPLEQKERRIRKLYESSGD